MKKRILCLFLVLCMVFTLMPMSAVAAEDYRTWAQGDSRWGGIPVGNSGKTISGIGCLVTSTAKLIIQSGLKDSGSFNVATLANFLNNNGGYTSDGDMYWGAPTKLVSSFVNYGDILSYSSYSSSEYNDKIISWIKSGRHMAINVNGGGHWIAVDEAKSLATGTVYIMDSLSGTSNADITLAGRYPTFNSIHAWTGGSTPSGGGTTDSGSLGKNLEWKLDSAGVLSISGTGAMPDYEKASEQPWYKYHEYIKKISIKSGVTSIGAHSFSGCYNATAATKTTSVTTIEDYAFYDCYSLETFDAVSSITKIGDYAFGKCTALGSVKLRDGLTSIGNHAFYDCTNLVEITIPVNVSSCGYGMFSGCSKLATIAVADGNEYFCASDGLLMNAQKTRVVQCPGAKSGSIVLPDTVTRISSSAFNGCSKITSIKLTDNITVLSYAFSKCTSLKTVYLKNSTVSVGNYAFNGCSALANVYFLGSKSEWDALTIGTNNEPLTDATLYCYNSGTFGDGLSWNISTGGTLTISGTGAMPDYSTAEEQPWYEYHKYIKKIVVNKGITEIGDRAFEYCSNVTTYTIPSTLKTIGVYAFGYCKGLTAFIANRGLQSIEDSSFLGCSALASVTLNEGLESIGNTAFSRCTELTSFVIPASVVSCGYAPLGRCTTLESISVADGNKNFCVENGLLMSADKTKVIMCPGAKSGKIVLPETVNTIGSSAFNGCSKITSVSINSKSTIGTYAFYLCSSLKTVYLSGDIASIGKYAFDECSSLANVYYYGPESDWKALPIGENNAPLLNAILHFHDHSYTLSVTAPTCTEQGYTKYTCECGDSYIADYVPALGHDYSEWAVTTAPTCTEKGVETRWCSRCDAYETRELEALGPDYVGVVTKPTCTEQGYTTYTCACGESYVADYVDALGHNYVDGKCTRCGADDPDYKPVANEGKLKVSDACTRAGEEVTVSVSIEENPGVMVMALGIDYDKTKLELIGFEDGLMTGWKVAKNAVWIGADDVTANGVILKLKFKVLEDVEDGDIQVSLLFSEGDIANHDEEIIMPDVISGRIIVYSPIPGDVTGDGKVNALDLVRLQRYLSGENVEIGGSCDITGDGKINALDLVRLQRYLSGEDVAVF